MNSFDEKLNLLGTNWNDIKKRVIVPLWNRKFKIMYENIKMDYDDFESLAALELTKAMKSFNPKKSNLFTYATNVLQRKAKTELTFYHRDRRVGNIEAESISKLADDDATITLEDILMDREDLYEKFENNIVVQEILQSLKKDKERKIIILSVRGYDDKNIAEVVGTTTKRINELREELRNLSSTRRMLRKLGYSLGGIEL